MPDTRTISQLEAAGHQWIGAECCKGTTWVPFRMIREAHPDWLLSAMTLDEVGARLRCEACGKRPARWTAPRQSDGSGFARGY
jgi:hypothetical protein